MNIHGFIPANQQQELQYLKQQIDQIERDIKHLEHESAKCGADPAEHLEIFYTHLQEDKELLLYQLDYLKSFHVYA